MATKKQMSLFFNEETVDYIRNNAAGPKAYGAVIDDLVQRARTKTDPGERLERVERKLDNLITVLQAIK